MSRFFICRPIVVLVISIIMVIVGIVSFLSLPVAQYPNIVPPEIAVNATYVGADALTVEQAVATPIEQQMSGVDHMNYMYSLNASNGSMKLTVDFDINTDPNIDQVLTQMRESQAESQLPSSVRSYGVTVAKSTAAPLMVISLASPSGQFDSKFLANYAYINLNDPLLRVPGIASVSVFGAGQYALRVWVNPNKLAALNITTPEIESALMAQNTVNPAGQIGGEPIPPGQPYTNTVVAQGRLVTEEQFGNVVIRAEPNGAFVRVRDVGRVELGAQTYSMTSTFNGKPAAVLAIYQLPGSNAVDAAKGVRQLMEQLKTRFPSGLSYSISLDTTLAVTAGMEEIYKTLVEAMILVIIVVFIFLQGWRATLIPLCAVPVSLISTFAVFPLLGFSVNTLSLLGLVLAIGLVVDDAIVVVEAVEHHIEHGLPPREAAIKAMDEVSGPVIAIALILAAVFIPTAFIPGITGRLYQQFAVTIAVSVIFSAFNALTLSPALAAMLLRPKKESHGPLAFFFKSFNRIFGSATNGYVSVCRLLMRRGVLCVLFLLLAIIVSGWLGGKIPGGFVPTEDQGYLYANLSLPDSASLQRTAAASRKVQEILLNTPGIQDVTAISGYSMLSGVSTTYNGFFFVTLKPWKKRDTPEQQLRLMIAHANEALSKIPEGIAFVFPPPAIPGIGTSGGVTFLLEDRGGMDVPFLARQTQQFVEAASKRPEIARITTTLLPSVPQYFLDVDQDKVLKQGVDLSDVYKATQVFLGGSFVNYFNRFGRTWQVYVQADGPYRTVPDDVGRFYVRNKDGNPVPLSSVVRIVPRLGPEFTMRFNLHRCAQLNVSGKEGMSSFQVMAALEEVFKATMPQEMSFDYMGMSFQEQQAQKGVSPAVIFGLSLLFVFLILAAQYESWSLPFSVLLCTPIAVLGAFAVLLGRLFAADVYGKSSVLFENNVYAQIGLVMLIGLAAKNAILIVEFSKAEFEKGTPIVEAALAGARLRLRPILMTAFAFILGCVPLWTASGSGAASRQILGTTVIGGMLASTFIAIFLIPVMFYLVEKATLRKPKDGETASRRESKRTSQPIGVAEHEQA
ncbi:MAG: efflux RND transporter permease subunit [Verrucomicrobia bacterium]|nr:efflux RND transporter permease subunit [Verrucomicrobiota bacterium]